MLFFEMDGFIASKSRDKGFWNTFMGLDLVEYFMEVENYFQIEIESDITLETFGKLVDYIFNKISKDQKEISRKQVWNQTINLARRYFDLQKDFEIKEETNFRQVAPYG